MNSIFQSVLGRYNYRIEVDSSMVTLEKVAIGKSPVKSFFITSIIFVFIGVFVVYFISLLIGGFILFTAVPLFIKGSKFNDIENNDTNEKVTITDEKITIDNLNHEMVLLRNEIKELNYNVEKDKDISIGTVGLLMENSKHYTLIKIFRKNKRYVEDDIEIIANNISSMINEEIDLT